MSKEPVVTNLLNTDFYKFPMQSLYFHQFPNLRQKWRWKCRTPNVNLSSYADEIKEEINHLKHLTFSEQDINFLKTISFLKPDFIDFLRMFRFYPEEYVYVSVKNGQLDIFAEGPAINVSPFEIYVLEIVSEVFTRNMYPNPNFTEAENIINKNIKIVNDNNLWWSCFGTRRRFSKAWQEHVTVRYATGCRSNFMGTSNVYLAMKHNLRPIGTMGHEIFQSTQALSHPSDSQKLALEKWVQEYRGSLGIALTDIFGIDAFLKDFDPYFSRLFDGLRHDSGDPFEWGNKVIEHYKSVGIDSRGKSAVFSDGNTFEKAAEIRNFFEYTLSSRFGIGTRCTNDLGSNYPPLQHVMKVIEAGNSDLDMRPVAKISDSPGKEMCEDKIYEDYLRHIIARKINNG